jgi:heterodisulfide reductase subunit B
MKYALFAGCTIPNRFPGVENATRLILDKHHLNAELVPVSEFTCCPALPTFYSTDRLTWLVMAARNLVLVQNTNADLVTLCNGCFSSLLEASEDLQSVPKNNKVNEILGQVGKQYRGRLARVEGHRSFYEPVRVRHIIDVLARDFGPNKIKPLVKHPLTGIRVAVHYGCHYLRPTMRSVVDDPAAPVLLDQLVEAAGAESVPYSEKLACCGAGGGVRFQVPKLANAITADKYVSIKAAGADCIVTGCPYCLFQFDHAQKELGLEPYPVLHISQFLALAFGIEADHLGFEWHFVAVRPFLKKLHTAEVA